MTKIFSRITIILLFIIPIFISSCTEYVPKTNIVPEDLIQQEEFTNIMFDVRLTEVIIRQDITKNGGKHADSISEQYYNFIFDKHDVSVDQFQKSLDFYTNSPMIYDEINNSISDSLTNLKAKIKTKE